MSPRLVGYAERAHVPFYPTEKVTARQKEILDAFRHGFDAKTWLRPMDLGGKDSSWHSKTLAQLVKKGLVERRTRGSNRSYTYRATARGRDAGTAFRTAPNKGRR